MAEKEEKSDDIKKLAGSLREYQNMVFCFDTTGSMSPCIADVRAKMKELIGDMFDDLPNLKVGMIQFGDFIDGDDCINIIDLTTNQDNIFDFILNAPDTSGGDADECYELVLREALEKMSWGDEKGAIVVIGDAHPHVG